MQLTILPLCIIRHMILSSYICPTHQTFQGLDGHEDCWGVRVKRGEIHSAHFIHPLYHALVYLFIQLLCNKLAKFEDAIHQ